MGASQRLHEATHDVARWLGFCDRNEYLRKLGDEGARIFDRARD